MGGIVKNSENSELERVHPRDFQVGDIIFHSTWTNGQHGHKVFDVNLNTDVIELRLYGSSSITPMRVSELVYHDPTWYWLRKAQEVSVYDPTQQGDRDDDL